MSDVGKNGGSGSDLWMATLRVVEELREETRAIKEATARNERSLRKLARVILKLGTETKARFADHERRISALEAR